MVVTQQDVARLAGTSSAVVSYVLNNGPRPVSAATRERVLAAVAELNYRPNNAARSLRSGKSQVLGLVVPSSSDPFFAEITREVEQLAYHRGYVVMTANSHGDRSREEEYFALFREHQVDGVMLTMNPWAALDRLNDASIPVVLLDEPSGGRLVPSLSVDYAAGAFDATHHLAQAGHSRIAFVGGNEGLPSADSREAGWRSALETNGLRPAASRRVPFTRYGGYVAGLDILALKDRPTAAFISSDQQAVGFLRAAAALDVRVPDDFWLIAFDDTDDCLYTNPTLSTVRQPIAAMIEKGLDLLLDPASEVEHHVMPHELVLRRSTNVLGNDEPTEIPPPAPRPSTGDIHLAESMT